MSLFCGALMDIKKKETQHHQREKRAAEVHPNKNWLYRIPDPNADFENQLVTEITIATIPPEILKTLTPRGGAA